MFQKQAKSQNTENPRNTRKRWTAPTELETVWHRHWSKTETKYKGERGKAH